MSGGTQLWLVVLAVLCVLALLVLRRMSQLVGRTRELERFQRAARDLDSRFAEASYPLVNSLDEIRRRAGDPAALAERLPDIAAALRSAAADARNLRPPARLRDRATALARELDRAVRAVELVEHGLDALLAARGNRELEAQVSLKRGALNIRHAREAFSAVVRDVRSIRPADLAGPPASGPRPMPAVPTYIVDGFDGDPNGAFDPRM